MTSAPLVQLRNLSIGFPGRNGRDIPVVHEISLVLERGEKVGLIGASGSGKSLTALAIVGLTPTTGAFTGGEILIDGEDLLTMSPEDQRRIRGEKIGLVFQEAEAALNPVMTVGNHFKEIVRSHRPELRRRWRSLAAQHMLEVGLETDRVFMSYAHQLSGGQRQRVLIALAMALEPQLLVADEPTSSLDLLTQARILGLLNDTCSSHKASLLLISHDLDVVASAVDRVIVMLGGRIVEEAPTTLALEDALHPFTRNMVQSAQGDTAPLHPQTNDARPTSSGCCYADTCPIAVADCTAQNPPLVDAGGGRKVRCPVVLEGRS